MQAPHIGMDNGRSKRRFKKEPVGGLILISSYIEIRIDNRFGG